jgi:hypothetical protein
VFSPPVQIYSRVAADDHPAAKMACFVGNVVSKAVIDLSEDHYVVQKKIHCNGLLKGTSSPFASIVTGCTCNGCIDLKYGVIYMIKCHNYMCPFKANPKFLSALQYTLSCQESCGTSLCPKCHVGGILVDVHQQHTCHLYINMVDYVNCWKCSIIIYNITVNKCIVGCDNYDHHYCEECWLDDVGNRSKCGSLRRCVECNDVECQSGGINGMYSSPDTHLLSKHSVTQDEVRMC